MTNTYEEFARDSREALLAEAFEKLRAAKYAIVLTVSPGDTDWHVSALRVRPEDLALTLRMAADALDRARAGGGHADRH